MFCRKIDASDDAEVIRRSDKGNHVRGEVKCEYVGGGEAK